MTDPYLSPAPNSLAGDHQPRLSDLVSVHQGTIARLREVHPVAASKFTHFVDRAQHCTFVPSSLWLEVIAALRSHAAGSTVSSLHTLLPKVESIEWCLPKLRSPSEIVISQIAAAIAPQSPVDSSLLLALPRIAERLRRDFDAAEARVQTLTNEKAAIAKKLDELAALVSEQAEKLNAMARDGESLAEQNVALAAKLGLCSMATGNHGKVMDADGIEVNEGHSLWSPALRDVTELRGRYDDVVRAGEAEAGRSRDLTGRLKASQEKAVEVFDMICRDNEQMYKLSSSIESLLLRRNGDVKPCLDRLAENVTELLRFAGARAIASVPLEVVSFKIMDNPNRRLTLEFDNGARPDAPPAVFARAVDIIDPRVIAKLQDVGLARIRASLNLGLTDAVSSEPTPSPVAPVASTFPVSPLVGRKDDGGKLPMHLIPWTSMESVVEVLGHGARTYGEWNWVQIENAESRYVAAALRHIAKHQLGEPLDVGEKGSGLHHLAHAASDVLFALHFALERVKVVRW